MLIFDLNSIGNKLLLTRKRLGYTQSEVAEKAGLSDRTYADIERGSVNMRVETVLHICSALNITLDEIFIEETNENDITTDEIVNKLNNCSKKECQTALQLLNTYLDSLK